MKPHRRATIAERLTKIREDRGLTRGKVASDLNLALTTIAGYEQGYRVPRFDNLLKLANYYRVALEYLVGEEDEEYPPAKHTETPKTLPNPTTTGIWEGFAYALFPSLEHHLTDS